MACENEVIQLVCNPFSRIAIYSASYGRTEYESIQCTQPQGVKEESKYRIFCIAHNSDTEKDRVEWNSILAPDDEMETNIV